MGKGGYAARVIRRATACERAVNSQRKRRSEGHCGDRPAGSALRTIKGWTPRRRRCSSPCSARCWAPAWRWPGGSARGSCAASPPAEEPVVPAGVATVLSVLRSSALVVDENDRVVQASAPAYALGLVSGDQLTVDELAELVRQVRRDGQIRETELAIAPGGRHRTSPRGSRPEQPAGAGPRRGPHPRAPGRGDPPGLRRQRLPRAEDPGRRARTCSPRPCRRPPTTRRR